MFVLRTWHRQNVYLCKEEMLEDSYKLIYLIYCNYNYKMQLRYVKFVQNDMSNECSLKKSLGATCKCVNVGSSGLAQGLTRLQWRPTKTSHHQNGRQSTSLFPLLTPKNVPPLRSSALDLQLVNV